MEKSATNRSRVTHSGAGRVTALAVCQNSASIVTGSSTGHVRVFRVESSQSSAAPTVYHALSPLYYSPPLSSSIVEVGHFPHSSSSLHCFQSLIVSATAGGLISAWDLRSQNDAWKISLPAKNGPVTSFLMDPNFNWMIVSTGRGEYTCIDARYQVPVKTWKHPSPSPNNYIHRLFPYVQKRGGGERPWFMSAVGANEV